MILSENILYNIQDSGSEKSVFIEYKGDTENLVYACYLNKDGINIEKRNYQNSNKFTFKCNQNGIYKFVLFVKEKNSKQEEDKAWKQTESFEVTNYDIGVVASEDIVNIINCEDRLTAFLPNDGLNFNINLNYLFVDIAYLTQAISKNDINSADIEKILFNRIKNLCDVYENVILLNTYFKNCDELNKIVSNTITNFNFDNIRIIDTAQILDRKDGKIIFEDYDRFKSVVIRGINECIEESIMKIIENTITDVSLEGNKLIATIENHSIKDKENVKYLFYIIKDGKVEYKNENWINEGYFEFDLSSCGIYCVQGYIKYKNDSLFIKSHTVEYFSDEYRDEFKRFLDDDNYSSENKEIDYFKSGKPFEDFAVIQTKSKIKNDIFIKTLKFDKLDNEEFHTYEICGKSVGKYNRYAISSIEPVEINNKKLIFSGMIYDDDFGIISGKECINFFEKKSLYNKYKGIYSMAVIDDNEIIMSNDFFNFNRLFYYCDDENIVCSNRYHLILLVLKELGIKCELNE